MSLISFRFVPGTLVDFLFFGITYFMCSGLGDMINSSIRKICSAFGMREKYAGFSPGTFSWSSIAITSLRISCPALRGDRLQRTPEASNARGRGNLMAGFWLDISAAEGQVL